MTHCLSGLKREIWNAQEKAYRKRLKAERKKENNNKPYFDQLKLF